MRRWAVWLSLFIFAITLGWFWLLSHDLTFTRLDEGKPAADKKVDPKTEPKKG